MESSKSTQKTNITRNDITALWVGIIFSLLFTGLIWKLGPRLDSIELIPDQGATWYYWKLPNPSLWSRATALGFYILRGVNYLALGLNAFFILLHIFQTHIWYDGLAQDVPIWSSQGSVIVLLVWVLLMENNRRGMFFGKPLPISKEIIRFARKYHGYFFGWATVYTFWFHPAVSTSGHLVGFLYMFLLLLQGSLFFTRIHTNRWWTFFLEAIVLIHGTLVAVMQGNNIWPMFAFGFGGVLVITQMHGLNLPKWIRWGLLTAYAGSVLYIYSSRGWAQLNEIIRIPIIDYIAVLVLAGIFWIGLRIFNNIDHKE
jgi:hypothetical protein